IGERVLAFYRGILQFRAFLIKADIDGTVFITLDDFGLLLDTGKILCWGVENKVDFAGKQGGGARGGLLDRCIYDFSNVSRLGGLTPPICVFGEYGFYIDFPRTEFVR